MNKQSMKELCEMNARAYMHGVLSSGCGAGSREIHLRTNTFIKLFGTQKTVPYTEEYDQMYVEEDGFLFFTLIPKGGEQ